MPKEIIFKRKLIDNKGSLSVNIPIELVEAFELRKGDIIKISVEGETIVLSPLKEEG
ncbi:MAG: AbrB/MazE/SpoVT family DNA-binding domain-containing protein [Candidatus Heimdallarchaeota archaeon]